MPDHVIQNHIKPTLEFSDATPLWKRAPTHTPTGEFAADFMILLKQLNKSVLVEQQHVINIVHSILDQYSKYILLADLNLKTNLLWVSHLPRPQLGTEIAAAICYCCPSARLIAHKMI